MIGRKLAKTCTALILGAAFWLGIGIFYHIGSYRLISLLVHIGQWLGIERAALRAFAFTIAVACEALLVAIAIGIPLAFAARRQVLGYWVVFLMASLAFHVIATSSGVDMSYSAILWFTPRMWLDMLAVAGLALPLARRLETARPPS